MKSTAPDYLDTLTEAVANGDPAQIDEWEATKIVAQIAKARKDRGLTQAQVAERMGIAQQHVARLENRPWSVGFSRVVSYARAVGVEVGVVGDFAA